MNTLAGAAEPPEHPPPIVSWTGQFSLTPACCRPDLHWPTLLPATTAGIAPGHSIVWPVNTAAGK